MNIRTYREEKKLSQADFAKLLSDAGYPTSQGLISQWEQGIVKLTPDRAMQIEQITSGAIGRMELLYGDQAEALPPANDGPQAEAA